VVEVIPVKASALARRRILVVLLSLTPRALDSELGGEYEGLLLPLLCSDRTDLSTTTGHRPYNARSGDDRADDDGEQIVELHVSVVFFGVLFLNSMSSRASKSIYKVPIAVPIAERLLLLIHHHEFSYPRSHRR
jgi:hypothetical protein